MLSAAAGIARIIVRTKRPPPQALIENGHLPAAPFPSLGTP